jgi:hypothetical protein
VVEVPGISPVRESTVRLHLRATDLVALVVTDARPLGEDRAPVEPIERI